MPMSHSITFCGLSLCWKEQFNSPTTMSFAVSLAVHLYNSGLQYTLTSLLKNAELEVDTCLQRQWRGIDKERMTKQDYGIIDTSKKKGKFK